MPERARSCGGSSSGPNPSAWRWQPNKGLLVVCDFGLHTVSIVDLKTGDLRAPIPAGRHPYFVAITPDERMAVVANLLPSGPAAEHTSTAVVSLIDLDGGTKIADIPLPDNSANVRQVRVSPDGRWAYVVHTRGRTMLPTTQLDRGWVNTNALSIIDLAARATRMRPLLLDTVTEGAADPWGIALSPDGKTAWISIAGAHQIARIELGRLHDLLAGGRRSTRRLSAQIGDAGGHLASDPGRPGQTRSTLLSPQRPLRGRADLASPDRRQGPAGDRRLARTASR